MAQRRHARSPNWLLIAGVPLLLTGAAVLFFVLRDTEQAPQKAQPTPSPMPPFAFTDIETAFVPVGVKIEKIGEDVRQGSAEGVATVLSTLYDAGFVTQKEWGDGTFPTVLQQFSEKAAPRAGDDLAELTLGPESASVASVTPGDATLEISVLLSKKREPVGAVAHAEFEAEAKLKGGGSFFIDHRGVFFLEPDDDGWKIVGWQVDGTLDSAAATAAPTPTETPS